MAAKLSGGGGGAHAIKQNADINVTPFVDILLVLLIIFMVAVPTAVTSIKVDLPPAASQPAEHEPVFVSIGKSGLLTIAGRPTSLDALEGDLTARFAATGQAGRRDDQRVMVRADADVDYADFMGVMNQLHTAGWYRIGLINEAIR
ncbi:MAG: biopolymer transporter ExbD [Caulobacter sp.]|nr:biopolymer transporter ExbD [Caulobacter sp.]